MKAIVAVVLLTFVFATPLLAVHFYARVYVEPTIEQPHECKDPNAQAAGREAPGDDRA